jgi:hypothetical protein
MRGRAAAALTTPPVGYDSASPAGVAQLAEQPSCKRQVSGSNPLTGSQVEMFYRTPTFEAVERFAERTIVQCGLPCCYGQGC